MSKERMTELVATTKMTRAGIEEEICTYTEYTKEERYHLIFDAGWSYLHLMEGDPLACEQIYQSFMNIINTKAYWGWWRTQWFARDMLFREKVIQKLGHRSPRTTTPQKRQNYYKIWHDPKDVSKGTNIDKSYYHFLEIQGL